MFPKDDPKIIIYGAVKRSEQVQALSEPVKEIIENISKYYNIYSDKKEDNHDIKFVNSYINKDLDTIKNDLNNYINLVIIGNGNKIINQYPINTKVTDREKLFIVTNSNEVTLPNLTNYSRSDALAICNLLNIKCLIKGNGYVVNQSIPADTLVDNNMVLEVILENKLKT